MKTPCEMIMWHIVPWIRRELALALQKEGLTQVEVARKLGVTEAAVSQYISGKRGNIQKPDKKLLKEIRVSAKKMIKEKEPFVVAEICRICQVGKNSEMFSRLYKKYIGISAPSCVLSDDLTYSHD